ncbi:MAG: T9SS type A sorting domain-containing protein [Mesonia hippocampi]|uniref:T9SS type A sorting domain-containing protein n=1 Tax=Mesonia hippocampi TaxID=1628250 RepID=UPI003F945E3A
MRKYVLIIIVLFVATSFYAQTQQQILADHSWNVYKVEIDGQEHLAPINQERIELGSSLLYSFGDDEIFSGFCYAGSFQQVTFINDNQWEAFEFVSLAINYYCTLAENIEFAGYYADVMEYETLTSFSFYFEITDLGNGDKKLVVTNVNGDKAYFSNKSLAVTAYLFKDIKVYPNPAQTVVNISLPNHTSQMLVIKLYDVLGKEIKTITQTGAADIRFPLDGITAGVYFLELKPKNHNGKGQMVKLIKQ